MQHPRSLLGLSGLISNKLPNKLYSNHTIHSAIFDETKPQVREPIVQCVQIKALPPQPNHPDRYRAVFSDIANYVQTMLATRMLT